ncbi:MAG: methylated-DNA--[Erysipelotrichaceae bacterium]|nr:methylated-DNA--[protein]-cysteine S-methyltransferase [Erysipelotrichaceae bacterium]
MMHYGWKYKTPKQIDDILLQSDGAYLTGLLFENSRDHIRQDKVQKREMLPVFKETVKWLDSYFSGRDPGFIPPYRIEELTPFRKEVYDILTGIPFGETISYGKIASLIADKRKIAKMSSQVVGQAVGSNPICIIVPCHRVIGSDGSL